MLSHTLVSGFLFGLYYGLLGLGLNLIFGVMRIVNLAHGDFVALGAYLSIVIYQTYAINPILSLPIAFIGFLLLAVPLYIALVPRLLAAKDPEMLSFILFFGLSQVLQALISLTFGATERSAPGEAIGASVSRVASLLVGHPLKLSSVQSLGGSFPISWVVCAVFSTLAVAGVYMYLYHSRLGYLTRAVMSRRDEALASGIDVHRVCMAAFAIGLGLAGSAGIFAPFMLGSISPDSGVDITVTSFVVIVMGALGNPAGAVLGGMVYGISYMLMQAYFSSWASTLPFVLLVAILLIKPSGLLGKSVRNA